MAGTEQKKPTPNVLRVFQFPEDVETKMNIAAMQKFPGQKSGRRDWLVEAINEKLAREAQEQEQAGS